MATVTLKKVGKTYSGGTAAVKNVSLEIKDKEFVVLVGPSGCGKSCFAVQPMPDMRPSLPISWSVPKRLSLQLLVFLSRWQPKQIAEFFWTSMIVSARFISASNRSSRRRQAAFSVSSRRNAQAQSSPATAR